MKTEWSPRFLLDYTHEFYSSYGYSFIKIVLCYCQKGSFYLIILLSVDTAVASLHGSKDLLLTH